jgi:hypothetical protein
MINNLVKGNKPATQKLNELYLLIRDEYSEVLTKKDLSTIFYTICNRLEDVMEEEKELALNNGL